MFDGFARKQIRTRETTINLVQGGEDDPVLLLHGYPQTHVCWHCVAPLLAERFTVICADLRGYGDSAKPLGDPKHLAYSKRAMAQDQVEVLQSLGFEWFTVVGHDRGARVAHRMALDHPEKITKLALLDITRWAFAHVYQDMATAAFNWFFLIQEDGLPERLIEAEPAFYLQWILDHWADRKGVFAQEAIAEYRRCFDTEAIRAISEEYRASATIDLMHDAADADRKISCPTLVLWSATGMWAKYGMLEIWQESAKHVQGVALDCGHFLPKEAPERTAAALVHFLP